jgi:hypothetical protein
MKDYMINRLELEPVETTKEETLYMVPIIRSTNKYEVFIGKKYLRIFNDDNLPNYIRSPITLAQVASTDYHNDDAITNWDLFLCRVPNMDYVGWRVSESLYIVVLNEENLTTLRGERH